MSAHWITEVKWAGTSRSRDVEVGCLVVFSDCFKCFPCVGTLSSMCKVLDSTLHTMPPPKKKPHSFFSRYNSYSLII